MATKKIYVSRSYHTDPIPFESAEEAWFWFIAAQQARAEGARFTAGLSHAPRPCEPIDILKALDRLYRSRRLMLDHFRVLRHYGLRHMAPDPRRPNEAKAHTLWEEAMMRLETVLEKKGIVRLQPQFSLSHFESQFALEEGIL